VPAEPTEAFVFQTGGLTSYLHGACTRFVCNPMERSYTQTHQRVAPLPRQTTTLTFTDLPRWLRYTLDGCGPII
jgi:hypothetical protein